MPYVTDENNNHILDENGDKIEYFVEYSQSDFIYKHKEEIHLNDDGHLDTEDRHIVIKDGINDNHAVCKKQLNNAISDLQILLNNTIQNLIKQHEAKILTQMFNFRNEQIKNRIQRKYLTIPKTINVWIKLLDNTDVGDNVTNLKNVIILNVWIKRWNRYHNAKSALLEKDFGNSIEFFYNSNMTEYHTYFSTVPSNWDMSSFIEWLRIPQPISIEYENEEDKNYVPEINVIPVNKNNNNNNYVGLNN